MTESAEAEDSIFIMKRSRSRRCENCLSDFFIYAILKALKINLVWYIARILVNIPCLIWCRFWWAGQSCEWLTQHLCYVDMVMHPKFLRGLWPKPVHHSFTSSCASFCRGRRRVIFLGKNKKEHKYQGHHGWQGPQGLGLAWILQNRKRRPWILANSSLVNHLKK